MGTFSKNLKEEKQRKKQRKKKIGFENKKWEMGKWELDKGAPQTT